MKPWTEREALDTIELALGLANGQLSFRRRAIAQDFLTQMSASGVFQENLDLKAEIDRLQNECRDYMRDYESEAAEVSRLKDELGMTRTELEDLQTLAGDVVHEGGETVGELKAKIKAMAEEIGILQEELDR